MSSAEAHGETCPPRAGEELDAAALGRFLAAELGVVSAQVQVAQFPDGASNLTYLVSAGGRQWVLRRPPAGTKAKSAHDMGREYRILSRIHGAFPYAPQPVLFCGDSSLLGEPFYLMERLEGLILRRDLPAGLHLTPEQARALCENLVDVHAQLHAMDFEAAGLADLGRPEGYVARQIAGWSERYRAARTDDVPDNEALMAWLETRRPAEAGRRALIHNDFKFDNVVLTQRGDRLVISGVLDWEMATLGDPLMDLGASLAYWVQADDPEPLQSIRMLPTHLPGMLRRDEVVERYARQSGTEPGDFRYYYVYGLFRLAVIVQQIWYRYVRGETRNPRFATFGACCAVLSRAAEAAAGGATGSPA